MTVSADPWKIRGNLLSPPGDWKGGTCPPRSPPGPAAALRRRPPLALAGAGGPFVRYLGIPADTAARVPQDQKRSLGGIR
ncbi:hypothetical protein GCM10023196_025810 [Actinoallomurus vinaceus]|uniref:Uncharacterized protein n=1 Tax=Actinoallomurus vinaceus TaxID=1080074 RepID=A0ABP8U6B8_9ACTN